MSYLINTLLKNSLTSKPVIITRSTSVPIEHCEERIAVSDVQLVDSGIFHSFSPACINSEVPCISAETNAIAAFSPFLIFLSLIGDCK